MALVVGWDEHVAVATINRPESRNAVDLQTINELSQFLTECIERQIRVIVLTGADLVFCAGADLHGVRDAQFADALHQLLVQLANSPCVTIAAINGAALGAGAQLAMSCDLRVATQDAVIGIPAARLGLVVNHWTVERLARECTWPIARAMLLAAQNYSGADLVGVGAIHKLGDFNQAVSWAHQIAQLAPLSIAGHKAGLSASCPPPQINQVVASARDLAWASNDAKEGRDSFLEKRTAKFSGT